MNMYNQKDFLNVMSSKGYEVRRHEITDSKWERLRKYFPERQDG